MPTYEYKCEACGHAFEKFQTMSSAPVKVCPVCNKKKVKRLIGTGAGLIFKGSGFYITDYRDKAYSDKAKADGAPSTSESKPVEATPAPAGDAPKTTDAPKAGDTPKASGVPKPAEAPKPAPKAEPKASKSAKKK